MAVFIASDIPTILPKIAGTISGYFATVRIELNMGGRLCFPSHCASDFLIFRDAPVLLPGKADLVISVDGVPYKSADEILPHASPATRIPIQITAKS